jgi:hypothetical protein
LIAVAATDGDIYRPPQVRGLWLEACAAALSFWLSASVDERISAGFRKTCSNNHAELRRLQAVA